ncbi:hypothetical protein PHMEG_0005223 [Phytophthora megakarya]|uniref:Uncharacterized protein n=1 Tax=Phytophthora megakarya TaxID=4795 RepID=A0A225WRW9_9STRA|nr:hypothetical protein PHMEG_0005223 [Phytophthora megakarya]
MRFLDWLYLLPDLRVNLNHTPVRSFGGHAPAELFTGLPASSPLGGIDDCCIHADPLAVVDFTCVSEQLGSLRHSLHKMHKEVWDAKEVTRVQDTATHKGRRNRFGQWIGPFKVTEAKPHSFAFQHLISGCDNDVHASRLKYYTDPGLNQTAELMELVASQGILLGVDAICDHRFNQLCNPINNWWEPLMILLEDVPYKVRKYAAASDDVDLLELVE